MKTFFNQQNVSSATLGLGLVLTQSAFGQTNPQFIGVLQPDERASRLTWATITRLMKSIKLLILAAFCASGFAAHAITNTAIAVSGTNLVLSWPSYGYEVYLVQYRHTLDPSDFWSDYTNAYPANSTNRTTLTLSGLAGSSGMNQASGNPMSSSMVALPAVPLAIPKNSSAAGVPVCLYPPGFDFSSYLILDPATGEEFNGALYSQARALDSSNPIFNSPQPMGSGGTDSPTPEPETGFYRVFHIPDFLADFSNYTFNGPTFIPVDFDSPDAPVDYVDNTTVLVNGQPTDIATLMPYVVSGVTNWGMGVYFDRLPNGTNTIQLVTTVRQSDTLNDQTAYMVFSNAPATITIGNFVTYTNWADLALSNTYTFNAQTVSNVDWEIDIYDAYNNFVNYQTGHSSDGNIAWTWDFIDYWGNSRSSGNSDPFFYPYITITQTTGNKAGGQVHPNAGGGSSSSWMPPVAAQYPDEGAWLFAYMDKFYDDGTSNYADADSYYFPAITSLEGGPGLWGTVTYDAPIKYGRDYDQSTRNASWDSLRSDLQSWNARNFYYFGHGAANSIVGDINEVDSSGNILGSKKLPDSKAVLTAGWVHENVTANKSMGAMPFRFVFLDGCNTANGGWPAAWGVPKQSVNSDWYKNSTNNPGGYRPNAFLGWDVTVGGKKENWGTVDKFWQFREFWMGQWSVSYGTKSLTDALDDARNNSGWVPNQVNAHLKKYGYMDMTFRQYNHAGDWP